MRSLADNDLKALRGSASNAAVIRLPWQWPAAERIYVGLLPGHVGIPTSEPASSESSLAVFITMVIVWLISGAAEALTSAI